MLDSDCKVNVWLYGCLPFQIVVCDVCILYFTSKTLLPMEKIKRTEQFQNSVYQFDGRVNYLMPRFGDSVLFIWVVDSILGVVALFRTELSVLVLLVFLWELRWLVSLCRNLREMFKIDAADYMMSICGNDALRELSSPGKSGSVFFLSQDDRFMIKTLRKSEVKVCHLDLTWFTCMLF